MRGKLITKNALYEKYQFDYKNAYFYEINLKNDYITDFERDNIASIVVFQSYETIIGFCIEYVGDNRLFWYIDEENRHHSRTTAKQTTQFINSYNGSKDGVYNTATIAVGGSARLTDNIYTDFRINRAEIYGRIPK